MSDNVVAFPDARLSCRSPPEPEPASVSQRIEGLLEFARMEVESMLPMTRGQRIELVFIFERVMDQIDRVIEEDGPPPGNVA